MKCLVCGREYVNLGVHTKHKHGLTADEYKMEFGLLMTQPLVDPDLSEHLSRMAKIGMVADPSRKAKFAQQCRENADQNRGGKLESRFNEASRQSIARSNVRRNEKYIESITPAIAAIVGKEKTGLAVQRTLGVSHQVFKRVADKVGYSKQAAREEATRRYKETAAVNTRARIDALMRHYDVARTASEMCRLAGVGTTTYKRFVKAGLMPRKVRVTR